MPLSLEDFAEPKFITPKEKKPFGENVKDKFIKFGDYPRSYRGAGGTFPQQGYNPNLQQATPRIINIDKDELTLPPY